MRYIYLVFCVMLFGTFAGCKTQTANIKTDPYKNVNVEFLRDNCKPEETYSFPVFGMHAMPSRVKNCAGIDDMFVVVWPGENSELEQTIAKLLTLLYVRSHNDEKDPDLKASLIKYNTVSDENLNAAFYELTEVPVEKTEEKTPQE